jgi:hypothetical protein
MTSWDCLDCGKNTWDEYYMLKDSLWEKIHPEISGMLCLDCAERRLGRKLVSADFMFTVEQLQDTISVLRSMLKY